MTVAAATDDDILIACLDHFLCPAPTPGGGVVMDNQLLRSDKVRTEQALDQAITETLQEIFPDSHGAGSPLTGYSYDETVLVPRCGSSNRRGVFIDKTTRRVGDSGHRLQDQLQCPFPPAAWLYQCHRPNRLPAHG